MPKWRVEPIKSMDVVVTTGIVAIASLEGVALATGHDGVMFAGALAAIGSLVGARLGVKLTLPPHAPPGGGKP